ncbi:inner membrane CreD family protein [Cardiobacterium hominis]|uniref:inner membrane CreD family protein n=1 Tax=Cardiobacterium hominis TaxID=2718 RepID=UPI00288B4B3B|nr:inner membrane CreD family protein [Cardiobacterium hominis]
MEKTTQKLVIIAVICAILLIALQLFDGLVRDRAHYAAIAQENVIAQVDHAEASATLGNRLDLYRLTERSSKYAVLFLLITFGGCFLFETLRGLRIHPVQYTLVGAAVCIFYLLLLSLGEYTGFTAAYLIAALACNGLITGYLSAVLGGMRRAAVLGGLLVIAYAVLYLLLQSQEYTLLIGSLLLFATLAGVMYGTRHFDWYDLKKREDF